MIYTIVFIFILLGCNHRKYERILYVESPDSSNVITILTRNDIRYIIDGKYKNVPNTDYVKLDISQITDLSDELGICWNTEDGFKWRLVNHKARIMENKLDSHSFDFKEELEKDERGVPTMKEYLSDNCTRIGLYYNLEVRLGIKKGYNVYPEGSAHVYR